MAEQVTTLTSCRVFFIPLSESNCSLRTFFVMNTFKIIIVTCMLICTCVFFQTVVEVANTKSKTKKNQFSL